VTMRPPSTLGLPVCIGLLSLGFIAIVHGARLVKHDATFIPDVVLRVSIDTIQLDCQPRLSTLINGTYPAPPIYLEPERTTWVRVYNDADVNTTMVRLTKDLFSLSL
jgi:L-ascorbate oxidase